MCAAQGRSEPAAVACHLLAWFADHPKNVGAATRAVMSGVRTPDSLLTASMARVWLG